MDSSTLTMPVGTRSDRLLGRKVLVTGSSKGIGRGIAMRLAQEGADVVINYNSDPRGAEEALAEVHALGRHGAIIRANLGTVSEVRDLVAQSADALGGLGITINSIAPGAIETPINTNLLNDPVKLQSLVRQIPLNRLGKPNDVAGLAVFLASSDSDYVTGTTYLIDGGLTVFYQEQ